MTTIRSGGATPSETTVRSRAGGDIHVRVEGDGPALVWVAGLGDDATSFADQVPRFSADHTCISFDNRGTGQSTVLPGPYTTADYADDAHDVVTALGLAPVLAVGSSMGGAICQSWALRHPSDLRGLVLSNTWAEHDPFLDLLFRHWLALSDAGALDRLAESLLMGCFSGEHFRAHPDVIPEFLATPLPDLDGLKAAIAACRGHDVLAQLGAVRVPVLVLAAGQDAVTRPELSTRLAAALPDSRSEEIRSGHMIMLERPEEFAAAVRRFLDGLVA